MKNGIAMISHFSMPVKSLSATDSIGTWVMVKTNVSTVRPSEIEIGMPVIIRAISKPKRMMEFIDRLWRRPHADRGRLRPQRRCHCGRLHGSGVQLFQPDTSLLMPAALTV